MPLHRRRFEHVDRPLVAAVLLPAEGSVLRARHGQLGVAERRVFTPHPPVAAPARPGKLVVEPNLQPVALRLGAKRLAGVQPVLAEIFILQPVARIDDETVHTALR